MHKRVSRSKWKTFKKLRIRKIWCKGILVGFVHRLFFAWTQISERNCSLDSARAFVQFRWQGRLLGGHITHCYEDI